MHIKVASGLNAGVSFWKLKGSFNKVYLVVTLTQILCTHSNDLVPLSHTSPITQTLQFHLHFISCSLPLIFPRHLAAKAAHMHIWHNPVYGTQSLALEKP